MGLIRQPVKFLLFLYFFSGVWAKAQVYTDKPVVLNTETGKIHGTLCHPEEGKSWPVVLIIAGSGPTDRNGNNPLGGICNNLQMLAHGLAENGIASLRYDKRGIGERKEAGLEEKDLRFDMYVEDAESWLSYLKKDKRFTKFIIAGHSEGSLIGMLAASHMEGISFISMAGAGYGADSLIQEQVCKNSPTLCAESKEIIQKIKAGETVESMSFSLQSLFRKSVQPYLSNWFQYDPAKVIATLKSPVLIIQGTNDLQVPADHADILHAACPQSEISVFEEMSHILKPAPEDKARNFATYNDPKLQLTTGLVPRIVAFISTLP